MAAADQLVIDFTRDIYFPLRFPSPTRHKATRSEYLTQVRNLDHYTASIGEGQTRLSHLSTEYLAAAKAWQVRSGLSPCTANKLGRTIAAIGKRAYKMGLVAAPVEHEKLPELEREPECWSMDEFYKTIDVAECLKGWVGPVKESVFWPALLWTELNTGVRITAVMLTPTTKLDLDAGWINCVADVQKHHKDMLFDLLPETRAALAQLDPAGRGLTHVFDDWPYDRTQPGWRALTHKFRKILAAAGLPTTEKDLFHKLRRTFATNVAANAGEATAQSLLGHSHIRVTRRYLDKKKMGRPLVASVLNLPPRNRLRVFAPTQSG